MTDQEKNSIFLETKESLKEKVLEWGFPAFRATQLGSWLFEKRVTKPGDLKNLPQDLLEKLTSHYSWKLPELVSKLDSSDGSTKLLLRGEKGQIFETVILRYESRTSLCVSSQVGCKRACTFCQTGKLGFFRNLKAYEIVGQFLVAGEILKEEEKKITNMVFMGMGEPFDNFKELILSLKSFTGKSSYSLSPRRITVSTVGLPEKIKELAKIIPTRLALSLHVACDEERTKLMPINRYFPLETLKESLLEYQKISTQRITIEYLLIEGVNNSLNHAKKLVKFLDRLKAKVNLIPYNTHPGMPWERPSTESVEAFQAYLVKRKIPAPVRYSKGLDVSAACGQLAAKNLENLQEAPKRKNIIQ